MRVRVAPALLALLLPLAAGGCDRGADAAEGSVPWAHKASDDEAAKVIDGIGADEALALARVADAPDITRTPDGATLLIFNAGAWDGELSASAWIAFSPDGRVTGSLSASMFSTADAAAYDGGFLVPGPADADRPVPLLVSVTGKVTTPPAPLGKPRPARAGDLVLGRLGGNAFRPSDGTFAPLPLGAKDPLGGMMPTALDGSGALTAISGPARNPVFNYSPDGGTTWEHKSIELPHGLSLDSERMFTGSRLTLVPLLDKTQHTAGWVTRAAGDRMWTVTSFDPINEESWVLGLVGDRVLIGPFDDKGGTLITVTDSADRTEIKRDALRASGGKLYSMLPKVTESVDGKTWTDVPLTFPKD
jgi:hypothetical protein